MGRGAKPKPPAAPSCVDIPLDKLYGTVGPFLSGAKITCKAEIDGSALGGLLGAPAPVTAAK
eukprot:NODE_8145_length_248_cov_106.934673_g7530_i0.p2 GENE.NODE_8145_length_248_cov_106.934673_g7530_i0~~NODE_8145_length_248_cov_106.934673_g7530_i0.p2  ORF type:complete len:72 (-),score=26.03 NODE_8145_length_248_cov_106.934673_g7530_i0:32-217(-)